MAKQAGGGGWNTGDWEAPEWERGDTGLDFQSDDPNWSPTAPDYTAYPGEPGYRPPFYWTARDRDPGLVGGDDINYPPPPEDNDAAGLPAWAKIGLAAAAIFIAARLGG